MAASRAFCKTKCITKVFGPEVFGFKQHDLLSRAFVKGDARVCLFQSSVLKTSEKPGLEQNPFYEKYVDKIKIAQDSKIVEEERQDSKSFNEKTDRNVIEEANLWKAIAKGHQNKESIIGTKSAKDSSSQFSKTSLDSVLHMEYIKDLDSSHIEEIWMEYHKDKDCISACIPNDIYKRIKSRAKEYPRFIFPLPRENGYEFMFAEFTGDICLMTSLLQYQTLAENAPWVLAIRHFTELSESKGIVLMLGEIDTKQLSVLGAQWLGNQIQMYYATENTERINLLRLFNKEPGNFDHMSIINQLDQDIASGVITKPS